MGTQDSSLKQHYLALNVSGTEVEKPCSRPQWRAYAVCALPKEIWQMGLTRVQADQSLRLFVCDLPLHKSLHILLRKLARPFADGRV